MQHCFFFNLVVIKKKIQICTTFLCNYPLFFFKVLATRCCLVHTGIDFLTDTNTFAHFISLGELELQLRCLLLPNPSLYL